VPAWTESAEHAPSWDRGKEADTEHGYRHRRQIESPMRLTAQHVASAPQLDSPDQQDRRRESVSELPEESELPTRFDKDTFIALSNDPATALQYLRASAALPGSALARPGSRARVTPRDNTRPGLVSPRVVEARPAPVAPRRAASLSGFGGARIPATATPGSLKKRRKAPPPAQVPPVTKGRTPSFAASTSSFRLKTSTEAARGLVEPDRSSRLTPRP
jgi:hypothetical protein